MSPLWALFILISAIWIAFRVIQVFKKPAAEIDELLGLDIPPQPEIVLSNVGPNSVTLYWKPPENYHTPTTNHISVNGVSVAEPDNADGAITVAGLIPGHHYSVRAICTNNAGYTSYSRLIQVQTIPSDGHPASKLLAVNDPGSGKRPSTGGRRISVPLVESDKERSKSLDIAVLDETEAADSLIKLNQKLDALRVQQEDLEQQLEQETEEADKGKASLNEERDRLKKHLDDKEKAHGESRRQLNELEKSSKAAQRKKSAKERDLQKKKDQRQKMKEEIVQWASERETFQQQTEKLKRDRATEQDRQLSRKAEAEKAIEDVQTRGKTLDQEIRDWGTKVQTLERERKAEGERAEEEEAEADRLEKDEENQVTFEVGKLEQEYLKVETLLAHLQPQLNEMRQLQQQQSFRFNQLNNDVNDFSYGQYGVSRSARGSISQGTSSMPYTSPTYVQALPPAFSRAPTTSPFGTALGALNFDSIPDMVGNDMTEADVENMTGGALMSPSADILLPKNLLRDDLDSTLRPQSREPTALASEIFAPEARRDPQSPASQHSGAHSFLPSPPEDRASLHSANGPVSTDIGRAMNNLNDAAPRRSFFGSLIGRRPRDNERDQPGLSTLKQGESQSFGIDNDDESDGPRGHQRNISTLTNPFSNDPIGRGSMDDLQLNHNPISPPPRRSRFGFGKASADKESFYGLNRQESPRPTSTYSYEAPMLRSGDAQAAFPFPNSSGIDIFRHRASPLNADWSSMHEQSFSAAQSRRPSIQYGSTGNLSLGSAALPGGSKPPAVAPIGSGRPGRNKNKKLNPTAQSFVYNMFNRSESKKTPRPDKNGSDAGRRSFDFDGFDADDSPPVSRMSRDAHSVMTSTTDSHDSVGGDSLPSSDVTGSAPSTKDNLLSRLTRKSSSSKFTTPWSKDRKDKAGTGSSRRKSSEMPLTPSEADEEGSDYYGASTSSAYGSHLGTPIESKFDDRLDDGIGRLKDRDKAKSAARGSLSSSWSKMMGGKRKKETNTAMSETSESRDEEE